MSNVIVKFIRHHGIYNCGESAGFTDEMAADLVRQGAAVVVEVEKVVRESVVKTDEQAAPESVEEPRHWSRKKSR